MAGVQVMPAFGAVTTVDVRAEGDRAARPRKTLVEAASGSGGVSSTSLFVGDWRKRPRRPACSVRLRQCRSRSKRGLGIVSNLGGQYEDGFEDVHVQLMNFFTYKAVRTVLNQLYEMNPPNYRWFYNFVAVNKRLLMANCSFVLLGRRGRSSGVCTRGRRWAGAPPAPPSFSP